MLSRPIRLLPVLLLLMGQFGLAQNTVSGYVNFKEPKDWQSKIHLSQVSLNDLGKDTKTRSIAIADIQRDGYFKFDKKYFSDRNKIYQLHVQRIQRLINDTISKKVTFISSNKDAVRFSKGNQIFSPYTTTNEGDKEWKRLKRFESKLVGQFLSENETAPPTKGFVKDSLQILMVKLIGLKQLEKKNLLDKDITEHPEFYLDLLSELKQSDIDPKEYVFLDRKLAYLTNKKLEQKLQWSVALNVGLVLVVVGMFFFVVRMGAPKKRVSVSSLSRQEATIRNLILEGKTNKEIANELYISLSTVKTHITHIYNKLDVTNRQELQQKSAGTSP